MASTGPNPTGFVPTHWIMEDLLAGLTRDLRPHATALSKAVQQGVELVVDRCDERGTRSLVRLADKTELVVPRWAITNVRPIHTVSLEVLDPTRTQPKKPAFVNRTGRHNGSWKR